MAERERETETQRERGLASGFVLISNIIKKKKKTFVGVRKGHKKGHVKESKLQNNHFKSDDPKLSFVFPRVTNLTPV